MAFVASTVCVIMIQLFGFTKHKWKKTNNNLCIVDNSKYSTIRCKRVIHVFISRNLEEI